MVWSLQISALVAAVAWSPVSSSTVTPLLKVVELLQGMEAKAKEAKHVEEVEFSKFSQWCEDTQRTVDKSIERGASQIEGLSADIAKAEATAEELGAEVSALDASVTKAKAELKQATEVRAKERSDFLLAETDLAESVDALERAIVVLKQQDKPNPQAAQALLQVSRRSNLPKEAEAVIQSFLALSAKQEPAPDAYEFQSSSVVGMLEKLRLKFQDQKLALQKAEMNAKANFEVLAQGLTDSIEDESKRSQDKSASKSARLESAAQAKGDLDSTEKAKSEDEKTLADTKALCHTKASNFERDQVMRAEEVKAIQKAVEILSSDEVSGAADTHLPALSQTGSALVQLRGRGDKEEEIREHLTSFLSEKASHLGSQYLSFIASCARADPFVKVKSMIKDLIVKLQEQANSEANHKGFCDSELAKNKLTRENKQSEVEQLAAKVEQGESQKAQLAAELAALSDALAELQRGQAEATALRAEEKATNTKTVADSQAAQVAVQKAIKVLKEFYQKASESVSLLQKSIQKQDPYTGLQSEHGGVQGFLEVVLSDFARLEADTSMAEDQALSAYTTYMAESSQDMAVKKTDQSHKVAKQRELGSLVESLKKELRLTQEELDAASAYYDKLKPDCVDLGLSYEDRVRMREEEVQSLKEALEILENQDLA